MLTASSNIQYQRCHNRLTHSLEVSQIARRLAERLLKAPGPLAAELQLSADVAETGALAHDIGHPPFGHHGERILREFMSGSGGFDANAQTLRVLGNIVPVKLQGTEKIVRGLNLTRAGFAAMVKYPWIGHENSSKFGAYNTPEDVEILNWIQNNQRIRWRSPEADIADFADDVAYSIFDVIDLVMLSKLELEDMKDFDYFKNFLLEKSQDPNSPLFNCPAVHEKDLRKIVHTLFFATAPRFAHTYRDIADINSYASYLLGILTGDNRKKLAASGYDWSFELMEPRIVEIYGQEVESCSAVHPISNLAIRTLKALSREYFESADQESPAHIVLKPVLNWFLQEFKNINPNEVFASGSLMTAIQMWSFLSDRVRKLRSRSQRTAAELRRLICDIVAGMSEAEVIYLHQKQKL